MPMTDKASAIDRFMPVMRHSQLAIVSNTAPITIAANTSIRKRVSSTMIHARPMIPTTTNAALATRPGL